VTWTDYLPLDRHTDGNEPFDVLMTAKIDYRLFGEALNVAELTITGKKVVGDEITDYTWSLPFCEAPDEVAKILNEEMQKRGLGAVKVQVVQ
jgi:hypothetical protein